MRLCSYEVDGRNGYGFLEKGGIIDLQARIGSSYPTLLALVQAEAFEDAAKAAKGQTADFTEDQVRFLPLFEAGVTRHCVGLNYAAHAAEAGIQPPRFPHTFVKIAAAMVGHNEGLEMPALSSQFDFEGELAVIIGRAARNVRADDALAHVAGYACFMDGSVRDYQFDRSLDQGKNFFRSSAMGPCLVTVDEVGDLAGLTLSTYVNEERMQHTSFADMIFSVPALIAYFSSFTALQPGDVIATGTPEGVGFARKPPRFLQPGDTVTVEIERIGRLRNTVC